MLPIARKASVQYFCGPFIQTTLTELGLPQPLPQTPVLWLKEQSGYREGGEGQGGMNRNRHIAQVFDSINETFILHFQDWLYKKKLCAWFMIPAILKWIKVLINFICISNNFWESMQSNGFNVIPNNSHYFLSLIIYDNPLTLSVHGFCFFDTYHSESYF